MDLPSGGRLRRHSWSLRARILNRHTQFGAPRELSGFLHIHFPILRTSILYIVIIQSIFVDFGRLSCNTMRDFPIQSVSVVMRVAIEPSKCMVAMSAVREKLNNILFKYNDDMQGVPIAYENVSFPPGKDLARIYGEYPWLHVEVCADVLVFKPTPKESVLGRINKVSEACNFLLMYNLRSQFMPLRTS